MTTTLVSAEKTLTTALSCYGATDPQISPLRIVSDCLKERDLARLMGTSSSICKQLKSWTFSSNEILVGEERLAGMLTTHLSSIRPPLKITLDPIVVALKAARSDTPWTFSRDSRVVRNDGTHIIPYTFKNPLIACQLKTVLPMNYDRGDISNNYGKGFSPEIRERAIDYARTTGRKWESSMCCIEGGNCFIRKGKAVIGNFSLYLSMFALEEQGYFIDKLPKSFEGNPSDESIRQARNLALYKQREPYDLELMDRNRRIRAGENLSFAETNQIRMKLEAIIENETAYRAKLKTPVTQEEREKYKLAALELDAKIALTKERIAKELQIPKEKIAFIPQRDFHIDEDCSFIEDENGDDCFLVKDDLLLAKALESFEPYGRRPVQDAHKKQLEIAKANIKKHEELRKETRKAIEAIGCKCVPFPGSMERLGKADFNFFNGIKIQRQNLFFTNDAPPGFEPMQEICGKMLLEINPKLKVVFLENMSAFISEYDGGTHCLTAEV